MSANGKIIKKEDYAQELINHFTEVFLATNQDDDLFSKADKGYLRRVLNYLFVPLFENPSKILLVHLYGNHMHELNRYSNYLLSKIEELGFEFVDLKYAATNLSFNDDISETYAEVLIFKNTKTKKESEK